MLLAGIEVIFGGNDAAVVVGRFAAVVGADWGGRNWFMEAGIGGWEKGAEKLAWGPAADDRVFPLASCPA
jgi:hypothetical protein